MLLEKIKDYSFENMVDAPENVSDNSMTVNEQVENDSDVIEMSSANQNETLNELTNQRWSATFENPTDPNIQLSETIEFIETEARIQQETIEIESKERRKNAAIVIQVVLQKIRISEKFQNSEFRNMLVVISFDKVLLVDKSDRTKFLEVT